MKVILTYTLLVIMILSAGVIADDGLALMKVEQGARPAGMGAAFVAVPSDVFSSYYNPAGAVDVKDFTASFGHTVYWENIRLETDIFAKQSAVEKRIQRLENMVKSTKLDHMVEKIKEDERKIQ